MTKISNIRYFYRNFLLQLVLYLVAVPGVACAAHASPRGYAGESSLAAPAKTGGARRIRTDDILLAKQALYQLSYSPLLRPAGFAGLRRFC